MFFLDGSFKPLIVLNHCTALLVLLKDTLPINVHHCKKMIIDVYISKVFNLINLKLHFFFFRCVMGSTLHLSEEIGTSLSDYVYGKVLSK